MAILHQSFHHSASVTSLCESIHTRVHFTLAYFNSSVQCTASRWDRIQSMGKGIECEVLQTAFQEFQNHPTIWFLQCQEDHVSLMTLGLQ